MAEASNRDPWERRKGEGSKAYQAFLTYLQMGDDRSLAKVGEKLGKSRILMERWSSKYEWVSRILAWEDAQNKARIKAHNKTIKEMNERQAKIATGYQAVVLRNLQNLQKPKEDGSLPEVSPALALRMLEVSVRIERTARGEPESIVKQIDDKEDDRTKNILDDPETAKLATQLLKRVRAGESNPGLPGESSQ